MLVTSNGLGLRERRLGRGEAQADRELGRPRRCRSEPDAARLLTVPGVGPITACAILAGVPDMKGFRSGRDFAAWLGLVPRQNSTGGKTKLGSITKMGDRTIR
jgi:transposase